MAANDKAKLLEKLTSRGMNAEEAAHFLASKMVYIKLQLPLSFILAAGST